MLTASNAGHEYPALHRKGRPFELLKDKHGFVLGVMENAKYREYEIQLEAGDDMLDALNRSDTKELKGLLETVRQDVDRFAAGAEQFDDLTMMCLRFLGAT